MSKSFIFFVVIISCRALKETNNVAWFFVGFFFLPLQSQRFIFQNSFCHCIARTQERLITLFSLLAEREAGYEAKPAIHFRGAVSSLCLEVIASPWCSRLSLEHDHSRPM